MDGNKRTRCKELFPPGIDILNKCVRKSCEIEESERKKGKVVNVVKVNSTSKKSANQKIVCDKNDKRSKIKTEPQH